MPLPYLTPLGPRELAEQGIPPRWRYGMADRVRFSELDALNHVNHTACLRWFESLRLPYCRDYGISRYDDTSPELVLMSVEARYHAPMFASEDYVVTARTVSFRRSSFRMEYAVFAPDLRTEGAALVVLLERDGSGKFPLTDTMKRSLADRDGARSEGKRRLNPTLYGYRSAVRSLSSQDGECVSQCVPRIRFSDRWASRFSRRGTVGGQMM